MGNLQPRVIRLTVRGIFSHKLRSILTAAAIVLGVAMISGTLVLTNQITDAFNNLFTTAFKGTDVVLSQKPAFDSQQSPGWTAARVDRRKGTRRCRAYAR